MKTQRTILGAILALGLLGQTAMATPVLGKIGVTYSRAWDHKSVAKLVLRSTSKEEAHKMLASSGANLGPRGIEKAQVRSSRWWRSDTVVRVVGSDREVEKVVGHAMKLQHAGDFSSSFHDNRETP